MRVLILEPHSSGHHGPYLEWIAQGLVERGYGVTIATLPDSLEHPSLRAVASLAEREGSERDHRVRIRVPHRPVQLASQATGLAGLMRRELRYWRVFRMWFSEIEAAESPDVVLLPYVDYCLYALGLFGAPFAGVPWVGIAMRPAFHYREMGVIAPRAWLNPVKRRLFIRLFRDTSLRCLLTIDPPLAEYLNGVPAAGGRAAFLPQPVDFPEGQNQVSAKQLLGIAPERRLILVYGVISARKGIAQLLRAMMTAGFPENVLVLLAGKVVDDVALLLARQPVRALREAGKLVLIDRVVSVREEADLFAAADIVWLGYSGHYSASGSLSKAAAAMRPVIACEEGIIGWQTKRAALGEVVRTDDSSMVCAAIRRLLERSHDAGRPALPASTAVSGSFSQAQDILAGALRGKLAQGCQAVA